MGNEHIELDVQAEHETEFAVFFNDGDQKFWIPKSAMREWPEIGKTGVAEIVRWFAEKKGLI